jgi:ankyrin repeat protein
MEEGRRMAGDRANVFVTAVRDGDAARVRGLLAEDPSLADAPFDDGRTPLAMAARLGRLEVLRALLEAGAARRPEADPGQGAPTALMEAAAAGQAEAVALLLEHGVDPALRDRDGRTATDHAHAAGHEALATRLAPATEAERTVWSGPPTDAPGPAR